MPTLKEVGKIRIQSHYNAQEIKKAQTLTAMDFILDWFQLRIPSYRGGQPQIKSKNISGKVLLIQSGTGSGKSVTLAPELYVRFFKSLGKTMVITQPRIILATNTPEIIVKYYPDMILGKTIGYQTGDFSYKPSKGVLFTVIDLLAQQLKTMSDDDIIKLYSFIIIDECHLRNLAMDLTLNLVKQFLLRNSENPECPFLILTSATFDTKKYADYFQVGRENIIQVEGLNFPIREHYPPNIVSNYITETVNTVIRIHTENLNDYKISNFTDIIIFTYGSAPTKKLIKLLNKANEDLKDHYVVLSLTSSIFHDVGMDYQNIFKPIESIRINIKNKTFTPKRRVIISTNIAETGVTIDTLKYCIDTGFQYSAEFNPIYGLFGLYPSPISQASVLQRRGRVGRKAEGDWYPMYPKKIFDVFRVNDFPNLFKEDLTMVLLSIIIKNTIPDWDGTIAEITPVEKFHLSQLDFLDYPPWDSIKFSINKLYTLGLIDYNYNPTLMGLIAAKFSMVSIENIRMILAGYEHGVNIIDLVTIAAFMQQVGAADYIDAKSPNKYSFKLDKSSNRNYYFNKFFISDDFITCLFIWEDFQNQIRKIKENKSLTQVKKWCRENGLSYKSLIYIIKARDNIITLMIQSIGIDPFQGDNLPLRDLLKKNPEAGINYIKKIKNCIYEGYRLNTATWNIFRYVHDATNLNLVIDSPVIKELPNHEDFKQSRPLRIIVRNVQLRKDPKSDIYLYNVYRVSSMDGYVNVDDTFSSS